MPRLAITTGSGTVENAWDLVGAVTWSGSKERAARSLEFDLAVSQLDPGLPAVECPVGSVVSLWGDSGEGLFQGVAVSRTLDDSSLTMPVTAHDRGMYLAGNEATVKVRDETAEGAVARICGQYGVSVGELAQTGVPLRRKFTGVSLWQIVTTLYTLASQTTGRQYMARMEWDQLVVRERREDDESLVIRPGSNLLTSSTTESMENMVNSVGIYDSDGQRITTVQEGEAVALYGLMERSLTQRTGTDAWAQARQLLEEGGLERTITVSCLGDTRLTTGRTVVVRQPETGLSGVFWIDADTHMWKNSGYTVRLTLNLRNVMYTANAGGELK